jgi:hypothetical protein
LSIAARTIVSPGIAGGGGGTPFFGIGFARGGGSGFFSGALA